MASTVVIADDGFGWWPTVSSVEAARARGADRVVVVVTPAAGFAAGIPAESQMQLTERIQGLRLDIVPYSAVQRTEQAGAIIEHTLSGAVQIGADLLVTVGPRRQGPLPSSSGHPSVQAIGDCVSPRRVSNAITEGRHAGLAVIAAVNG